MSLAAISDPRVKTWSLEFCFPKIYNPVDAKALIEMVGKTLRSLHSKYVTIYNESTTQSSEQNGSFMSESSKTQSKSSPGSGFQELPNFNHESKYRILSKLARDILAIPITTVASEATFSAGSRVIHKYRASLGVETVQALLCGENWIRNIHGVKNKSQQAMVSVLFGSLTLGVFSMHMVQQLQF
ncbi:zinc finger BED domain-containing protein RICESLEEPER 2-like protein [Tanacetum coccineum]